MTLDLIEILLTRIIITILFLSTLICFSGIVFYRETNISIYNNRMSLLSFLLISILLLCRWLAYNHFPLTNLYESCIFLSWSLNLLILLISKKNQTLWLNIILFPSTLYIFSFPIISIPKEIQNSIILVPALQSNWLMMHVTMMILSYGSLLCGSLLAIAILTLFLYDVKKNIYVPEYNFIKNYKNLLLNDVNFDNISLKFVRNEIESHIFYIKKNNLINQLDNWSYKTISIGFILLTFGILSGAVWANEAWGSYWSWDPKETWALITWLIFAIYLHTRIVMEWKHVFSALIAFIGFNLIWICYLGVNILGKGFHSYGWFN